MKKDILTGGYHNITAEEQAEFDALQNDNEMGIWNGTESAPTFWEKAQYALGLLEQGTDIYNKIRYGGINATGDGWALNVNPYAPAPNNTPYIVGGVVLIIGAVALVVVLKKGKKK